VVHAKGWIGQALMEWPTSMMLLTGDNPCYAETDDMKPCDSSNPSDRSKPGGLSDYVSDRCRGCKVEHIVRDQEGEWMMSKNL
jgi:hypothetical protein